jgi:hypothetical protein
VTHELLLTNNLLMAGARTSRTKEVTWPMHEEGFQSTPRMSLRWTYLRGAEEDGCSSMYKFYIIDS